MELKIPEFPKDKATQLMGAIFFTLTAPILFWQDYKLGAGVAFAAGISCWVGYFYPFRKHKPIVPKDS